MPCLLPDLARAQPVEPFWDNQFSAYGVDGEVFAAATDDDGVLYLGGEFSRAGGLAADGIALWDGAHWSTLGGSLGRGFSGAVYAIAISPDGAVYIGGDFIEVVQGNGAVVDVANLAVWDGNSWEPLATGVDGPVYSLVFDDAGLLYIGGAFSQDGSQEFELSKIASWDGASLSSVGNGLGTFSGVVVRSLGFDSQGNLYAGGSALSGGIFRWDGQTWESFGARHEGSINSIAFDVADNLYAGGDFQAVIQPDDSELTVNRIARWNGAQWETLGAGFDAEVKTIGFDAAGMLHVAGRFAELGDGTTLRRIARWNSAWEAIGPGNDENLFEGINTIAFTGNGTLYALGDVQHMGGTLVNGVAYWNGQAWSGTGGMGFDNAVHALSFDDSGILYAGGSFVYGGPSHVEKIARWQNHAWEQPGQGINGNAVFALAKGTNQTMYVGGDFAGVIQSDGTELLAYNIAVWDGAEWSTPGTGVNGTVEAIVVDPAGNLFIGGAFTQDGSEQEARNYIAMWDGAAWSTPGGGLDGPVHALALDAEGQVLAGGSFLQAGSTANTAYLAKWNGVSWEPLSANTSLNGEVNALYLNQEGNLYVGGAFTQIESGLEANYVASWQNGEWSVLGSSNGNGVSSCCVAALSGNAVGDIVIGGDFGGVKNPVGPDLQANRVAIWRFGAGWFLLTSGLDGDVYTLASNGEDIMMGGAFQAAGGLPSSHVARWSANEFLVFIEQDLDLPTSVILSDIYPNPAMNQASMNLRATRAQHVRVDIYDTLGRKVESAFSGFLAADQQITIHLNPASMAAGTYIVRVHGDAFTQTKSVIWIK